MSSQANQTDIDALTTRLMAGRYGELQSLRALAIVEKQAPNLAEQFERLTAPRGGGTAGDDAAGDEGGDIVLTYETQRAFESMSAELHQLSSDAVVEQRLADPRFLRQLERVISSRMSADDTRTGAERVARLRTLLARRRLQRPPTGAGDAAARAPPSRQQRAALQPRGPPHEVVTMGGAEDPLGTMAAHGHHVMNAAASIGGGGGGGAMASDVHNLRLVQGASFELLLSIQRTLQQEVAALSAQLQAQNNQHAPARGRGTGAAPAAAPPSSTTTAPQPAAVEDGDGVGEAILPARLPSALAPYDEGRPGSLGACVVCCEADVNTLFYQCGHLCSCARCAHMLMSRKSRCPICRAPIRDVVQAFPACAPPGLAAPVRNA